MENRNKRILMSILGVTVCGISVGIFKYASFGVDPFQSLMGGLNAVFPISFGTLYVIVNICLLSFGFIFDRSKIGIGTMINLFFLGYIAEYSEKFLVQTFSGAGLMTRSVMLLIAIVMICFACSFYFTADLGVSTYDAVSLILSERYRKIPFKFWRVISDLICIGLGVTFILISAGSMRDIMKIVGIGTIITAFFMGPLIEFFNEHISRPFLYKK